MGKIKKRTLSLKWSFLLYLPLCLIISFAGAFAIGIATNHLQDWYRINYPEYNESNCELVIDENEEPHLYFHKNHFWNSRYEITYLIIIGAQFVIIPLWVFFCIGATGVIFYNREMKKPIQILLAASRKISENQLDFKVEYQKKNELGTLCTAFEEMRSALYKSNREMWELLEEHKRLNSAFSHDLRTPLTVLRGYIDFLQKYVPDGRVDNKKLASVLTMMNGHVERLEHYTEKMSTVQKLEDIIPEYSEISLSKLYEMFSETGKLLCEDKKFICTAEPQNYKQALNIDTEIIMQIYENLVSNAVIYTTDSVSVSIFADNEKWSFSVSDNGRGFSNEALKRAAEPFFRDEKNSRTHFGLGLYICRILCEKCGGTMNIGNNAHGGATVEINFQK